MAPGIAQHLRRFLGTFIFLALLSSVDMSLADQKATFGVVKNPIEMWGAEIAVAKSSVQVATYKFSSKEALEALISARARGLKVTLIVDGKEAVKSDKQITKAIKAGIDVFIWDTEQKGELHAKFSVIDQKVLVMGSFNLSKAASKNNTESFLICHDPDLTKSAMTEFQNLLNQTVQQH